MVLSFESLCLARAYTRTISGGDVEMAKEIKVLATPHTVLLEGGLRVTFPPGTKVEWDPVLEGFARAASKQGDDTASRAIARSLENHG